MVTRSFQGRRQFEDDHMPEVIAILQQQYPDAEIMKADDYTDEQLATDLVIQHTGGAVIHCGVRVRQPEYRRYWPNVTFRASYPGGTRTEWDKIMDGEGDIFFYDIWDRNVIGKWVIVDLNSVREEAGRGNVPIAGVNRPSQGGEEFREIKGEALKRTAKFAEW